MATSVLLDKEIKESGHDAFYMSKVFVQYQSTADIVTIQASGKSLFLGFNEAQEIAVALARFVKHYGSRAKEEEIEDLFN